VTREELYRNWLGWVATNLRDDPKYSPIAANAAVDAVVNGDGFNGAAAAATNAWIEAAKDDRPLWRPGFWSLLVTDRYFWALLVLILTIPLHRVAPALSLFALLIPPGLVAVCWKGYVFWRLSRRGLVVPGTLINVTVKDSDGELYRSTYEFNFHGQHFISRLSRMSTPEVVLILFDPNHPKLAMVIPELLGPGPRLPGQSPAEHTA
jgi:hypothetical protein